MSKDRRRRHRSQSLGRDASRPKIAAWKKTCYAAVVCIAFFLAIEFVLAMAGVEMVVQREDPFRGFSGLVSVFVPDGDVYRTRRATANRTFNDQSFLVEKPANGLRIFCLGGSSAYGYPWGARAAFTSILGDVLAQVHGDRHVEAINAAGISYAMHRVNIVADEVIKYRPDILIIFSGHNEFIEPDFFDALKHRSTARNEFEYLLAHSRLYSALHALRASPPALKKSVTTRFAVAVQRDRSTRYSRGEKAAVVAEFRWRLRRLVRRAQQQGVHVLLATVPCNLSRWRPEASITETSLDDRQRMQWRDAFASGKGALAAGNTRVAIEQLSRAAAMVPGHAETHFLLGQAYEAVQQWKEARQAYQLACDDDASPSRRISAINATIRQIATDQHCLLVDCDALFTRQAEHGLVGFNLIEDYVHPTRKAHVLIAWALWQAIERAGWVSEKSVARRRVFDAVVARRPPIDEAANATWLFNQGVILENQGSLDQAVAKYRQALRQDPGHEGALHNLAVILSDRGEYQQALVLLERLLRAAPGDRNGRVLDAEVLLQQGEYGAAVEQFRRVQSQAPDSVRAHIGLGRARTAQGDLDGARRHFREALRIDPENVEARIGLGIIAAGEGDLAAARSQFQDALKLRPDGAAAYYNLGLLCEKQGNPAEALHNYQRALRTQPDHAETHLAIGSLFFRQGKLDQARKHYRQAIEAAPRFAQAHYGLALIFAREGKLAEAIDHGEQAIDANPRNVKSLLLLAQLLAGTRDEKLRDPRKAIVYAKRAAALTQYKQAGPLETLAAAHAAGGDFVEAVRWQEKALARLPDSAKAKCRARLQRYRDGKP